jgi:hypothetical protein
MKATVLVEKVGKKKYRATTSQPIPLETEGASRDEALERLYELAKKRLAAGQLVQMNLPDTPETNRNRPMFTVPMTSTLLALEHRADLQLLGQCLGCHRHSQHAAQGID